MKKEKKQYYDFSEYWEDNGGKIIAIIISVVVAVVLIFSSFFIVSPGHRGVKVTLGNVEQRSYPNGLGIKWPFVSKVVQMDVRTQKMSEKTTSYTSDVQTAQIEYVLTYDLNPEAVHLLYETVGQDYETKKILPVLNDVLKDVFGKWQAQDIVSNRDKARLDVLAGLNSRLDKKFFGNITFQITNIDFSDNFEQAIENKVIAEQNAQTAKNNTVRIREEAEQKIITAKAEAEAMQIKAEALQKNKGLTEYEAVLRWDGKLPQYMMGNTVPMINLK